MAQDLFNAICIQLLPGEVARGLKYRKINNRKSFVRWIEKNKPDVYHIYWYDHKTKAPIEKQILKNPAY